MDTDQILDSVELMAGADRDSARQADPADRADHVKGAPFSAARYAAFAQRKT